MLNENTPRNSVGGAALQRTDSGICAELLSMGFPKDQVEFAVAASGGGSVQAALNMLGY